MKLPAWIIPPSPEQIRKRFDYLSEQWHDIRSEAMTDMRFQTGDPWTNEERLARKGIGRLCLDFDELGQYVNQLVNGVRQNKRAPKVTPAGNGANDQSAEMIAGMIKAIGYKSNADAARITAFEGAAQRSYGYYKIVRRYISDESDLQELRIQRIPNPDVIYLDYDSKEADFSDMGDAFELDRIGWASFRDRWRKAKTVDFSGELAANAPNWISEKDIQIAEYWKAHQRRRTRMRLEDEQDYAYLDEMGEGAGIDMDANDKPYLEAKGMPSRQISSRKEIVDRFVVKYITNGIEVMEQHPWTLTVTNPITGKRVTGGKYIPYVAIMGKELWIPEGSGSKRMYQSLTRMARTPYMAYCYTRTAQLEAIQLTSKSPYFVVEGQIENHEEEFKTLNKLPVAFQEYKAKTEATGDDLLPPPTRPSYIPEVQQLEVFAQAARQAIQAAIGFSNPQVQRNRTAPLSGKALDEFEQQGDIKTFHFIDNYDRGLEFEGNILKDLIPVTYDTERQMAILDKADKPKLITLNAQNGQTDEYGKPAQQQNGQPQQYSTDAGDHDLTMSVGPSYDSQREEENNFADLMVQNPQIVALAIQNPQSTAAKILAMTIKLKDLGPIGDAMAEAIDPSQGQQPQIPPQVQQAMQVLTQQRDQATALAGHLQQELKEKTQIATLEMENKRVIAADKNRTDMVVAALKAGAASAQAQLDAEMQRIETMWDHMHESELAPGPEDGGQGIHPTALPEPAQNGAASSSAPQ